MSKSKNINPILLIVIIVVIIAIGVGVYFLVRSKEPYNLCNSPSSITTKQECLTAARKLSGDNSLTLSNNNQTDDNFPKGCYQYDDKSGNLGYYFNNPPNGTGTLNAVHTTNICKPTYLQTQKVPLQFTKRVNGKGESIYIFGDCTDSRKCLSYDNFAIIKKNADEAVSDPQFDSCVEKVLKNQTINQTCRNKLKSWNKFAEMMDTQIQLESKINKGLKGDSSKGFVKALKQYTTPVSNYNGKFGTRLKTLFESILKTHQKVGECNQVINGEKNTTQLVNYYKYLGDIETCWKKANEDAENVNYFPTKQKQNEQKEFLKRNLVRIFNSLRNDGTLGELYSEDIIKQLKSDIGGITGVSFDTYEGFGFEYDSDGNLIENKGSTSQCYLITACTKTKLLSIGQVYQLRKVMLEAFKDPSNHKFFHFYYSNFQGIADFLESTGRLSEIVPDILEVVKLSKRGEMQSAFGRYISTARKAYQMCKDMKLDVSEIEQKWDTLEEFKMTGLPEPNTMFVEEPFRKALGYLGMVC